MNETIRLTAYRWMTLTRTFDETMVAMWKQGRGIGGTFSERGHEAVSVGAGLALGPDDVVAPMHRDLGTYLLRGMTPERIFGNLLGRQMGVSGGRDSNLHGLGDLDLNIIGFISHIPQAIPTALGAAMAFRYRDEPRVAMTFVGDGGSCSGAFHESLNMAALYNAPFVLIIENNQYAYSTPLSQEMKVADIAGRLPGYGLAATTVDGNDVEAVHAATTDAVERARAGGGPSVIEARTMRMLGHAIHDGAEYVPEALLAEWESRDPVRMFRTRLINSGVPETDLDALDQAAATEIAAAVRVAEAAPLPNPESVSEGVFA
ncbi:MAG: thiamine pyrophosphate-dependent dehydrogenase E1 component subunit alpha [Acidimicrobiia bacterium]|nr:thiamine pyrophosphate-dependent dehydrogenase E1 component subunit alpha [Acidimicrobiia bacterium]